MTGLLLSATDLDALKRRVSALAEDRPAVYRMIDPRGKIIYVGKSKKLRSRLLSYFRAAFPVDKAARIIHATADLQWQYQPSDFAAHLSELRQIKKHRPVFNVRMNRSRNHVFVKVSPGPAPKIYAGASPGPSDVAHYGPFRSAGKVKEAVRVLNDILGLRDCALDMPMVYSEQGELFGGGRTAACMRYELGLCAGPCGGLVSRSEYMERIKAARAFLEGRSIAPIATLIDRMNRASECRDFETATRWRDRFESLEWLLAAVNRTRLAIESLSFVYLQPGTHGDDRAYIVRRARVKASAPVPHTPLEWEAFRGVVEEHSRASATPGPLPNHDIDEILLVLNWFRRHPASLRRTVPLDRWLASDLESVSRYY